MGLVVDEIVDIVDDRLEIELVADRSDLVGSAVIRGRATEIVNVAHYLPLAHDDWARPAGGAARPARRPSSSSTTPPSSASMLTPVLKAAGYRVAAAESAEQALALLASGRSRRRRSSPTSRCRGRTASTSSRRCAQDPRFGSTCR